MAPYWGTPPVLPPDLQPALALCPQALSSPPAVQSAPGSSGSSTPQSGSSTPGSTSGGGGGRGTMGGVPDRGSPSGLTGAAPGHEAGGGTAEVGEAIGAVRAEGQAAGSSGARGAGGAEPLAGDEKQVGKRWVCRHASRGVATYACACGGASARERGCAMCIVHLGVGQHAYVGVRCGACIQGAVCVWGCARHASLGCAACIFAGVNLCLQMCDACTWGCAVKVCLP